MNGPQSATKSSVWRSGPAVRAEPLGQAGCSLTGGQAQLLGQVLLAHRILPADALITATTGPSSVG